MSVFLTTDCEEGLEVDKHNLVTLAAAIERGAKEDAFLELATLLDHNDTCAEWIAQGRNTPARAPAITGAQA